MSVSWDAQDLFALHIARAVHAGTQPSPATPTLPPQETLSALQHHKLLRLADPTWPVLQEVAPALRRLQRQETIKALQRVDQAGRVRDCLAQAGIPAVFFKGFALSQIVWGSPAARGAGDIDVLVPEADVERAVAALRRIGVRVPADIADLRPAYRDRLLHHAFCLDFHGVEVDLHYRLDDTAILAVPGTEIFSSARMLLVQNQSFPTLSADLTLLVLAANGGRDLWAKWGQVLDFARVDGTVGEPERVYGVRGRLVSGRAMVEWLTGRRDPRLTRRDRSRARYLMRRHAAGEPEQRWQIVRQHVVDRGWRWRSAPSVAETRRTALTLLAPGDAVGRAPDAGFGEYALAGVRKSLGTWDRVVMEPPGSLCDLVDAAQRGELDRSAFQGLATALRLDTFDADDKAVMPVVAGVIARFAPEDPFAARIAGVRRRARFCHSTTELLVRQIIATAGNGVVLGDLAAATTFHQQPGDRPVRASSVSLPASRSDIWQVASEVARTSGAALSGGRWPILQRFDVTVTLHPSLGPGFFCDVDASPEMVMYSSLVQAAEGAPRIEWYSDAVAAGDRLDWERVWEIGRHADWSEPVARATAVLFARGRDVPIGTGRDPFVSASFRAARSNRSRRVWLASYAAQETLRRHRRVPV